MPRPALYSRSTAAPTVQAPAPAPPTPPTSMSAARDASVTAGSDPTHAAGSSRLARTRRYLSQHNTQLLWTVVTAMALMLAVSVAVGTPAGARKVTQADINAAVMKTLETTLLPSAGARAYNLIAPSVVRVVAVQKGQSVDERSVGTGVVIVDKGVILTSLHVVQDADTIRLTFSDGLETTATVTGSQPDNDLAVLQAHQIPDDMVAATLRSTADLQPGDEVLAVGYPFGMGPSASSGVISGLKRTFRSPEGRQEMRNLIQFDAAANPGNSGGPLVTMDGEVIGIVTAIFNPNQQRTFVGIGFAVPIENAASAAGMPPF